MSTDYEPTKEQVEALERELCGVYAITASGSRWTALTRFVLRRQHERERGLLETLRSIERVNYIGPPARVCSLALAAHAKLDAPKVPTLAECEKRLRDLWDKAQCNKLDGPLSDALDAWKAAVERETLRCRNDESVAPEKKG